MGMLSGCTSDNSTNTEIVTMTSTTQQEVSQDLRQQLIEASDQLTPSENLYFDEKLEILALGEIWEPYMAERDDCYYWNALEKKTNTHIDVDWHTEDEYPSVVASTLLMDTSDLPDLLEPDAFGIMDLSQNGTIVPLDEYLELMPNIVEAVGIERMAKWREADGHIYSIPVITDVPGSRTMMIRKDWLEKLHMSEPSTWDEWVEFWRAVRDNDLNGNGDTSDEIPLMLEQGDTGERSMWALLNAFGIRCSADCMFCVLEDGTYTMVTEHPRYQDFLVAVAELYAEGLLDTEFETRYESSMFEVMSENQVGSTFTWAEQCRISTERLREDGVADALWMATKPVPGPEGDQLVPERNAIVSNWTITVAAKERGKVEDIIRFFNWCYSEEGQELYCYGIEGVSYDKKDGACMLRPEAVEEGFTGYRKAGMQFEPFGGYFQQEAFMQCLFKGMKAEELDEPGMEFYKGLAEINEPYFYDVPVVLGTDAYVKNHTRLIKNGLCIERNRVIKGEISTEEFWRRYEELKKEGLQDVMDEGNETYQKMIME